MTKDFLWRLKLHVGNWNEWPLVLSVDESHGHFFAVNQFRFPLSFSWIVCVISYRWFFL